MLAKVAKTARTTTSSPKSLTSSGATSLSAVLRRFPAILLLAAVPRSITASLRIA